MRRLAFSLMICVAACAGPGLAQTANPMSRASSEPAVTLGPPKVTLGPPIARSNPIARGQSPDDGYRVSQWVAALTEPEGGAPAIAPLQVPAPPSTSYSPLSNLPTPPAYNPQPTPPVENRSSKYDDPLLSPIPLRAAASDRKTSRERKSYFGEALEGLTGAGPEGKCFESDHCFENFISPMSNPYLFEDPRSLTEARPIFFYQTIPGSNDPYRGGSAFSYGSQFRVAFNDRWSVVMNKLGGVSINPGDNSLMASQSGFAEIWLGPKYTFIRNMDTGTVAAGGITFQIPAGSNAVGQATGSFSMVPYITIAQNFGASTYGAFNAMSTLGYSFRLDSERTNYFFWSMHLDYDIANAHKIYPLVELNWFHYAPAGNSAPYSWEGRDFGNFGSRFVDGANSLALAAGARYKFNECVQTGLVVEFPLNATKDLFNFRLGVDVIFRY